MNTQDKILELALTNREQHGLQLPEWRIVVRAPLPGPTSTGVKKPPTSPWLYAQKVDDIQGVMTPLEFAQRVDLIVGGGIDLQRAKDTEIGVMIQARYMFALSESFLDRHDAEGQKARWRGAGFDCAILPFLPGEPDCSLADLHIGFGTPAPEGMKMTPSGRSLSDLRSHNVHLGWEIDQAVDALERTRMIVRVRGVHGFIHKWEGISLTQRGVGAAERLRQEREEAERIASAPPPNLPSKYVKCRHCGGVYLETTEWFNPNLPVVGKMFRLIPSRIKHLWKEIEPDAKGRYFVCPNCRHCFFDLSTERIRPEDLLEPPKEMGEIA